MNPPTLDLSALQIFSTVAAEHSVTRAALRLGRVQSNVTTRVRQLEQDLGVPLFLREAKRMTLTAEGHRLLDYARRLLALADEARQAMQPGLPQGRLRVGTMESTAASRLPAPLARFHQRWPEVALELSTASTQRLIDDVLAHRLDCALVARATPAVARKRATAPPGSGDDASDPLRDAALEGTPVFDEELMLVLPRAHPVLRTPDDLQLSTLAAFDTGCTYRRLLQDWLGPRTPPLRVLELGSYHAILACVAAGTAFGVAPKSVLALQRSARGVRAQPLCAVQTLLIRRRGQASAAFDAWRDILLAERRT